jgi:peptide deformylase
MTEKKLKISIPVAQSKKYEPEKKYVSSTDVTTSFIVEEWNCELVDPAHPAMSSYASVNPFSGDIDWVEREQEMIALMRTRMGVGLASPQIGSSYDMFVMAHSILGYIGVYKPEIIEFGDELANMEEGCLSFPLLYIHVQRPEKVKVRYTKNDGETIVETWMDGMDARCFQHEIEHLIGGLFLDHASEFKLKRAKEKRDKLFKKLLRRTK